MTIPHSKTLGLLVTALLLVLAAIGQAQAPQPGQPTLPAPRLNSVTVQPSASSRDGFSAHRLSIDSRLRIDSKDAGVVVTNISVAEMLGIANNLPAAQVVEASSAPGAPNLRDNDWLHTAQFDLTAQGTNLYMPTEHRDVLRLIVQSALANHFHAEVSRQTRELPALALVADSSSSSPRKFHQPGPGPEDIIRQQVTLLNGNLKMINGSTYELARQLSSLLARPIVDQTGLTGLEDFTIQLTPPLGHSDNRSFPDPFLTAALKNQLGLELRPQTSPTPVLVVDHVDSVNDAARNTTLPVLASK
jgi:uncharacterized protein (TIGR03435 family)